MAIDFDRNAEQSQQQQERPKTVKDYLGEYFDYMSNSRNNDYLDDKGCEILANVNGFAEMKKQISGSDYRKAELLRQAAKPFENAFNNIHNENPGASDDWLRSAFIDRMRNDCLKRKQQGRAAALLLDEAQQRGMEFSLMVNRGKIEADFPNERLNVRLLDAPSDGLQYIGRTYDVSRSLTYRFGGTTQSMIGNNGVRSLVIPEYGARDIFKYALGESVKAHDLTRTFDGRVNSLAYSINNEAAAVLDDAPNVGAGSTAGKIAIALRKPAMDGVPAIMAGGAKSNVSTNALDKDTGAAGRADKDKHTVAMYAYTADMQQTETGGYTAGSAQPLLIYTEKSSDSRGVTSFGDSDAALENARAYVADAIASARENYLMHGIKAPAVEAMARQYVLSEKQAERDGVNTQLEQPRFSELARPQQKAYFNALCDVYRENWDEDAFAFTNKQHIDEQGVATGMTELDYRISEERLKLMKSTNELFGGKTEEDTFVINPANVVNYAHFGSNVSNNREMLIAALRTIKANAMSTDEHGNTVYDPARDCTIISVPDDADNKFSNDNFASKLISFNRDASRSILPVRNQQTGELEWSPDENGNMPSKFWQNMSAAIYTTLEESGVKPDEMRVDDRGIVSYAGSLNGANVSGSKSDTKHGVNRVFGEIGQIFEPITAEQVAADREREQARQDERWEAMSDEERKGKHRVLVEPRTWTIGLIKTNYEGRENKYIVPGYEGYILPKNGPDDTTTRDERTRLVGYEQLLTGDIKRSVRAAVTAGALGHMQSTALNSVYTKVYKSSYEISELENVGRINMLEGDTTLMQKRIDLEKHRVHWNGTQYKLSDISNVQDMQHNQDNPRYDDFKKYFAADGSDALYVNGQNGLLNGYVTATGKNVAQCDYLNRGTVVCPNGSIAPVNAQFDKQGNVVRDNEGHFVIDPTKPEPTEWDLSLAVQEEDSVVGRYMKFNPVDRNSITISNFKTQDSSRQKEILERAEYDAETGELTKPAVMLGFSTVAMDFGGWTQDDGCIVSSLAAKKMHITSGTTLVDRSLIRGDKNYCMEDGNKVTTSLVVDPNSDASLYEPLEIREDMTPAERHDIECENRLREMTKPVWEFMRLNGYNAKGEPFDGTNGPITDTIDIIKSSQTGTSRYNAGGLRAAIDSQLIADKYGKNTTLKMQNPDGTIREIPRAIGYESWGITDMAVDVKEKMFSDAGLDMSVEDGDATEILAGMSKVGRKVSYQSQNLLMAMGCRETVSYLNADKNEVLNNLRVCTQVLGYDIDESGKFVGKITPHCVNPDFSGMDDAAIKQSLNESLAAVREDDKAIRLHFAADKKAVDAVSPTPKEEFMADAIKSTLRRGGQETFNYIDVNDIWTRGTGYTIMTTSLNGQTVAADRNGNPVNERVNKGDVASNPDCLIEVPTKPGNRDVRVDDASRRTVRIQGKNTKAKIDELLQTDFGDATFLRLPYPVEMSSGEKSRDVRLIPIAQRNIHTGADGVAVEHSYTRDYAFLMDKAANAVLETQHLKEAVLRNPDYAKQLGFANAETGLITCNGTVDMLSHIRVNLVSDKKGDKYVIEHIDDEGKPVMNGNTPAQISLASKPTGYGADKTVIDAVRKLDNARESVQSSYDKLVNNVCDYAFTGKNSLAQKLYSTQIEESATSVITADPSLPLDTISMSVEKMEQLGLIQYDKDGKRISDEVPQALFFRNPTDKVGTMMYCKVTGIETRPGKPGYIENNPLLAPNPDYYRKNKNFDPTQPESETNYRYAGQNPNLKNPIPQNLGIHSFGINPNTAPIFSADFDGDSFGVVVPQNPIVKAELEEKATLSAMLLNKTLGYRGNHPLSFEPGMDAKRGLVDDNRARLEAGAENIAPEGQSAVAKGSLQEWYNNIRADVNAFDNLGDDTRFVKIDNGEYGTRMRIAKRDEISAGAETFSKREAMQDLVTQLDGFFSRCEKNAVGKDLLVYGDEKTAFTPDMTPEAIEREKRRCAVLAMESLISQVHDGVKGNIAKLAQYGQYVGVIPKEEAEAFNEAYRRGDIEAAETVINNLDNSQIFQTGNVIDKITGKPMPTLKDMDELGFTEFATITEAQRDTSSEAQVIKAQMVARCGKSLHKLNMTAKSLDVQAGDTALQTKVEQIRTACGGANSNLYGDIVNKLAIENHIPKNNLNTNPRSHNAVDMCEAIMNVVGYGAQKHMDAKHQTAKEMALLAHNLELLPKALCGESIVKDKETGLWMPETDDKGRAVYKSPMDYAVMIDSFLRDKDGLSVKEGVNPEYIAALAVGIATPVFDKKTGQMSFESRAHDGNASCKCNASTLDALAQGNSNEGFIPKAVNPDVTNVSPDIYNGGNEVMQPKALRENNEAIERIVQLTDGAASFNELNDAQLNEIVAAVRETSMTSYSKSVMAQNVFDIDAFDGGLSEDTKATYARLVNQTCAQLDPFMDAAAAARKSTDYLDYGDDEDSSDYKGQYHDDDVFIASYSSLSSGLPDFDYEDNAEIETIIWNSDIQDSMQDFNACMNNGMPAFEPLSDEQLAQMTPPPEVPNYQPDYQEPAIPAQAEIIQPTGFEQPVFTKQQDVAMKQAQAVQAEAVSTGNTARERLDAMFDEKMNGRHSEAFCTDIINRERTSRTAAFEAAKDEHPDTMMAARALAIRFGVNEHMKLWSSLGYEKCNNPETGKPTNFSTNSESAREFCNSVCVKRGDVTPQCADAASEYRCTLAEILKQDMTLVRAEQEYRRIASNPETGEATRIEHLNPQQRQQISQLLDDNPDFRDAAANSVARGMMMRKYYQNNGHNTSPGFSQIERFVYRDYLEASESHTPLASMSANASATAIAMSAASKDMMKLEAVDKQFKDIDEQRRVGQNAGKLANVFDYVYQSNKATVAYQNAQAQKFQAEHRDGGDFGGNG